MYNHGNMKILLIFTEAADMNKELREKINATYDFCDSLQEFIGWDRDIEIRDIVKMELLNLAMYISASDGRITYSEAKAMADHLEMNLPPDLINKFIRENNIYSTEFESEVPLSIKLFVDADNRTYREDPDDDRSPVSEILASLFKDVAQEIAIADGNVDDQEKEDWSIYADTLKNYLNNNLDCRKAGVRTGITKNSDAIAPKKSGSVIAPRKG